MFMHLRYIELHEFMTKTYGYSFVYVWVKILIYGIFVMILTNYMDHVVQKGVIIYNLFPKCIDKE